MVSTLGILDYSLSCPGRVVWFSEGKYQLRIAVEAVGGGRDMMWCSWMLCRRVTFKTCEDSSFKSLCTLVDCSKYSSPGADEIHHPPALAVLPLSKPTSLNDSITAKNSKAQFRNIHTLLQPSLAFASISPLLVWDPIH